MSLANRKSLEPYLSDDVTYYKHQVEGIRHLSKLKSFLLADDMGLGKSLQAITIFAIDIKLGWSKRAIIVCPPTLKENWADELDKFTTFKYVILDGLPAKRDAQLIEFANMPDPKILIVNYEQVKIHLETLNAFFFDIGIFDEAHYVKNHKAQRTKAAHQLGVRRKFLLTGTPMLNKPDELWSLLHMIDPQYYPKYWSFVNRFCVYGGWNNREIVGVKNEKELRERLGLVMIRRLKKDVLDLPEVQIIERRVELTPEQRKVYDQIEEELQVSRVGDPSPSQIENALVKFLRLKQVCGTTLEFTGKDSSAKLDLATEEDVQVLMNGKHLVVFTQFRTVQAAYIERMKHEGFPIYELNGDVPIPRRKKIVTAWESDRPGVIVCMLQVAGLGLNMTKATNITFLDELFVPGLNQQAIDRVHRIGVSKTQPVQVRLYVAKKTIDNRIRQILRTKVGLNENIIEMDTNFKKKLVAAVLASEDDDT